MEKILPLNKSIVSKIEKISQDSQTNMNFNFTVSTPLQLPESSSQKIDKSVPVVHFKSMIAPSENRLVFKSPLDFDMDTSTSAADDNKMNHQKLAQKACSFESALTSNSNGYKMEHKKKSKHFNPAGCHSKHKQNRRLKLQFDDQSFMDCGNINDFLSSSSLSSSDSETEETNEDDHEGDDELTDWPGHEAMVNFASKNEFKRANKKATNKLPQIKQQDDIIQDDDTLMSADDVQGQTLVNSSVLTTALSTQQLTHAIDVGASKFTNVQNSKVQSSHPINIAGSMGSFLPCSSSTSGVVDGGYGSSFTASYNHKQPVESEMSGKIFLNNFKRQVNYIFYST